MCFAWSKTKKTSGERSWKQNGGSKFLDMCLQRSTVMEFCISVCLLLFLENAFWMAKQLPRRDAGGRAGPAKAKMARWLWANCEGTFPYFFGRQKTRCALRASLRRKGGIALSQNTLKKIKISPRIYLFPSKDVNAMLKSILVTTANGKPQTATSRLPFAVNAMLKVPNVLWKTSKHKIMVTRI